MSSALPPDQRPAWASLTPMPASRVSNRKPIIVGHRGACGLAPENTLAAFQVAANLGIDGVEFDVQLTKDGHPIVFHDDEVQRVTDGTGQVIDLTLSELETLDAGATFAPQFRGERIASLREALDFLRGADLLLFIELKAPWRYPGIEEAVVNLVREFELVDRALVSTFHYPALYALHGLAPEIALAELWFDRLPHDDEITFNTIDALDSLCTPEQIARLHRRGVTVTAWTVNDLDLARDLMNAGIDGLTTDYPDRLLRLFEA
jgi:glycerophosphoryl diester phosphodiesterase